MRGEKGKERLSERVTAALKSTEQRRYVSSEREKEREAPKGERAE